MTKQLFTLDDIFAGASPSLRAINPGAAAMAASRSLALKGVRGVDGASVAAANDARAARSAVSREAQRQGGTWEDFMADQHGKADAARIARLQKQEPEVVGANGRARRVAKSGLDYVGHIHFGGPSPLPLYIEAKRRTGRLHRDRWVERKGRRVEDRDGIADHQIAAMTRCAADGAVVLVAVELVRAAGPLRYALPWVELERRWASPRGGVPSVGPEELAGWEMHEEDGGGYLSAFATRQLAMLCGCDPAKPHLLTCVWRDR